MVFCSLDALKKASKKKEARIKMETVEVLQQTSYVERDGDDEILGFGFVFVGQNNTDFNIIFFYYWLFSKSHFSGI